MKHFSHPHPLEESPVGDEEQIICSCCEESLAGEAYSCSKPKCQFSLHKSCSDFPRKIEHKSHIEHKLTLHSKPPSEFCTYYTCDACENKFNAFIYHCSECQVFIHPKCAFLPETVKRVDHEHPLQLYYSSPYPEDDYSAVFACDVCQDIALKSAWVYYCSECDYGTHFGCVNSDPVPVEEDPDDDQANEEGEEKINIAGEGSSSEKNDQGEAAGESGDDDDEEDLTIRQIKMMDQMAKLQFQMDMNAMNARTISMLFRTHI